MSARAGDQDWEITMNKVEAIIRPEKPNDVKEALA